MRRWLFARYARNYVVSSSSRIIPNPKIPLPLPLHSTSLSSFSKTTTLFPHLRSFSQLSQITHPALTSDADDVIIDSEENENAVVQEEILCAEDAHHDDEGKPHEIDAEEFENVLRLLQDAADVYSLESSLDSIGLTLHQDHVLKAIETPNVSAYNLIRFIKWALNEKSFNFTVPVVESLVSKICTGGGVLREKDIYSLWDLVKDIAEKQSGDRVLNVCILNEVIRSFSKLGKGRAAHEVFDKFELFQCVPNADTYYFTIEALCRRKDFDEAWLVCQTMLDGGVMPDECEKVGKMISWFCKGERVEQAHTLYLSAKEKGKLVPMCSVSFLIAKLCQQSETSRLRLKNGKPAPRKSKLVHKSCEKNENENEIENVQLASEMLYDIAKEERKHAIKSFSAVIQALCRIKEVDAAKELVLKMITDGPPPGNGVFNFVITEYAQAGQMVQAMEMLKLLESRGLKPDLYTYAVLMSGYTSGGEMEEARKILEEAKKKHDTLTPVMYHTLIRGYCKLEQFDEALKLLSEMKDFGVRPNADEYEKLIQSLCFKSLDWETAEKLQEEMKENGLHLKGISRALIRAVKEMEKEVVDDRSINSAA